MWARCLEDGTLLADDGRVEIRYKAGDGKAYFAAARNLTVTDGPILSDAELGEASRVEKKNGEKKSEKVDAASYPVAPEGDETLVYADGACQGNPGPAGLGVVLLDGEGLRELSEYLGEATNNIAELTAILRAVEASDPKRPLRLYTDSSYAIGVLQKGWKAKANVDLVARVKDAIRKHGKVRLHHVRGHAGVPLNERADELAVDAVKRRASSGWRRR